MNTGDTIAAISTPPGRGGIGIVRLSGPAALDIARHLFHALTASESPPRNLQPNRSIVGHAVDSETAEPLDTAVLTYFQGPRSYTGEDVVEISCHGSPVILARVLDGALGLGARLAEPGEFTLRAFLNHRMDLAQAQAVRDLIEAQTAYQARLATRQLDGALSRRLRPLKESLIEVIVHLESSIEFVEDDISPVTSAALMQKLDGVAVALLEMSRSFELGRYVRQGFDLAIAGRPNVGKSSIFNRLVGADRAIVTEVPGTTRDALHESTSIDGIPVRLIDTAGIRETTDLVESIGITRTREAIADADIQLLVLDGSEPLTEDDKNLIRQTPASSRIILINKTDLSARLDEAQLDAWLLDKSLPGTSHAERAVGGRLERDEPERTPPPNRQWPSGARIKISALTGAGFDILAGCILEQLAGGRAATRDDIMITDARQHQAVKQALAAIAEARDLMIRRDLEELVLLKLRAALQALGELTGETLNEDILAQIFSTFCIGK